MRGEEKMRKVKSITLFISNHKVRVESGPAESWVASRQSRQPSAVFRILLESVPHAVGSGVNGSIEGGDKNGTLGFP